MKQMVTIFAIFVAMACHANSPTQAPDSAMLTQDLWVHLDSEWRPYGEESGLMSVAYARVLQFSPAGEFSWIACMLLHNTKRNSVSISAGDGQVFFLGRWQVTDDHATVEYVKAREMVHVPGSDQPFEKKQTATVEMKDGVVIFEGLRFTKSFSPDTKAYEKMVGGVREWEAEKLRSFFAKE